MAKATATPTTKMPAMALTLLLVVVEMVEEEEEDEEDSEAGSPLDRVAGAMVAWPSPLIQMNKCCCAGVSNTQKAHLLIIGGGRVERVGGVSFVLLARRKRWCFECIDACWGGVDSHIIQKPSRMQRGWQTEGKGPR